MLKLGLYQHYKGKYYNVISMARHSESLEEMVVYQCLYSNYGMWVRPLQMFQEEVIVNGVQQPRFKYIAPILTEAPKID